jgi:S-adenosylmethionine decarboxylase
MHVAVDGYTAAVEKLTNPEYVRKFLAEFPASIGMTRITEPMVITYHAPKQEDWGVTGVVIIAESHISIHTFPDRNLVFMDVFSCMPFNVDLTLRRLRESFDLHKMVPHEVERGLEFYNQQYGREARALQEQRIARPV